MSNTRGIVYFNHGKESGPWGSKITALAGVAKEKGFAVQSPDYQDLPDAGPRVERLLGSGAAKADYLVLVGSSMGGYVATVASAVLKPHGLFLMAPAFYMPGYPDQNPTPSAKTVTVVHGWSDNVIPVEHSIRFARKFSAGTQLELHIVEDDHRFSAQLPFLERMFGQFLDQVRFWEAPAPSRNTPLWGKPTPPPLTLSAEDALRYLTEAERREVDELEMQRREARLRGVEHEPAARALGQWALKVEQRKQARAQN